ncbi:MAG: hypothetical protein AAGC53_15795 [Actinomycetota bacterium]
MAILALSGLRGRRRLASIEVFVDVMTAVAWICLAQIAVNLATGRVFTYATVLPEVIAMNNFNHAATWGWQSSLSRSNGFIFLEPSLCGQFLALAIVAGIASKRSRPTIGILLAGFVTTGSGTGLLVLLAGALVLISSRPQLVARLGALAGLGLFLAVPLGLPAYIAERSAEFSSADTSADRRFILPYEASWSAIGGSGETILFGAGAGNAGALPEVVESGTALFPAAPKLAVEYGLIVGPVAAAVYWAAYRPRKRRLEITVGCFVLMFVANGGPIFVPSALVVWYLREAVAAESQHGLVS